MLLEKNSPHWTRYLTNTRSLKLECLIRRSFLPPSFSSKSLVVTRSFRALKPLQISSSMRREISRPRGSLPKTIPLSQRKFPRWKKQSESLTNIFCLSLHREIPMMPVMSSWKSKQVKAVKNQHSLPQILPGCICATRIRRGGRPLNFPPLTPS